MEMIFCVMQNGRLAIQLNFNVYEIGMHDKSCIPNTY